MGARSYIKSLFLSNGLLLEKAASAGEVIEFVEFFKNAIVSVDLVRIGGKGDGGYLIPDDLDGVKYCFSPGVDVTANFENELSNKFGIKCFLADASVAAPPIHNELFEFDPKFLGAKNTENTITLGAWIKDKLPNDDGEMLLQMDIEGAEFDVLIESSIEDLRRFRIIIIEFHEMQKIFNRTTLPLLRAIFQKVFQGFSIAHVHRNNASDAVHFDGISVPPTFEVSFIRNDRIEKISRPQKFSLPHHLDSPNAEDRPDPVMPEIWWA